MTTLKHTPGPWEISQSMGGKGYTILAGKHPVGGVSGESLHRQSPESNARLMAALPDLLEALEGALVFLEHLVPDPERKLMWGSLCSIGHYANHQVDVARAAIARATGKD